MSWQGMDRRKFPRVMYPCLVKVATSEGLQEGILTHTENIGIGGLCVTVKKDIKLFTSVDLEVDLLDINELIKAKAKIVWNVRRKSIETIKPMFYDIGIEFTEIAKRDSERLRDNLQILIEKGTQLTKPYI